MAADLARRRALLAAAAALPIAAVSGCQGIGVIGAPPSPAPDVVLLEGAITAERLMVDRYAAVLRGARAWPARLVDALEPLQAEHQAHLAQLESRLVVPPGSAATPSASRSRAARQPAVPTAPATATAFLSDAEQAAASAMLARLPHAPASLAQLFASISASEATHVPVLGQVRQAAL